MKQCMIITLGWTEGKLYKTLCYMKSEILKQLVLFLERCKRRNLIFAGDYTSEVKLGCHYPCGIRCNGSQNAIVKIMQEVFNLTYKVTPCMVFCKSSNIIGYFTLKSLCVDNNPGRPKLFGHKYIFVCFYNFTGEYYLNAK